MCTNLTVFIFINLIFQLAQKLREEHESASVVFVEDGHEEAVLHGEEQDFFQKFLPLEHKQVFF